METAAILIIALGTAGLAVFSFEKGLKEGFSQGAKIGFSDGTNKTLTLLQKPLRERHGVDVGALFNELMNDDEYMKETFHVK